LHQVIAKVGPDAEAARFAARALGVFAVDDVVAPDSELDVAADADAEIGGHTEPRSHAGAEASIRVELAEGNRELARHSEQRMAAEQIGSGGNGRRFALFVFVNRGRGRRRRFLGARAARGSEGRREQRKRWNGRE
jgi:hypothetical protein